MFFRSILSVDISLKEEEFQIASQSAISAQPDAILFSLTRSDVDIKILRERAKLVLARTSEAGIYAIGIPNHPRTGLLRSDLDAIVSNDLDAVFLPDISEPQDIRDVVVLLREFELVRGLEAGVISLFPIISSARALLRAFEIMSAAPRVGGLILDIDGYAHDVRARFEQRGSRLAWARGNAVAIARSLIKLPIVKGADLELRELANTGFEGVVFEDPKMVAVVNDVFAPTATEIEEAHIVRKAFAEKGENALVARLGESFIDEYKARKAEQIIDPLPRQNA